MMTSFAFILGVVPLVVAQGAGAEMRQALGTAVFSGMLGVTLFGIFFTPVFFMVIEGLGETRFFANARVQQYGSAVFGALAGLIAGVLLHLASAMRLPGALLLGVTLGVVSTTLVTRLRQRYIPRRVPGRALTSERKENEPLP